MQVTAVDLDDPDNFGRLEYSTVTIPNIDNDGSGLFEIDSRTGWVTVRAGADLDRETQDNYLLRIRAADPSGAYGWYCNWPCIKSILILSVTGIGFVHRYPGKLAHQFEAQLHGFFIQGIWETIVDCLILFWLFEFVLHCLLKIN